MPLAKDQDMIQALAPKRPDRAFDVDSARATSVISGSPIPIARTPPP